MTRCHITVDRLSSALATCLELSTSSSSVSPALFYPPADNGAAQQEVSCHLPSICSVSRSRIWLSCFPDPRPSYTQVVLHWGTSRPALSCSSPLSLPPQPSILDSTPGSCCCSTKVSTKLPFHLHPFFPLSKLNIITHQMSRTPSTTPLPSAAFNAPLQPPSSPRRPSDFWLKNGGWVGQFSRCSLF